MPLPTPSPGEPLDDFISRCVADPQSLADFPDRNQRIAVCISQFEDKAEEKQLNRRERVSRARQDRMLTRIEIPFRNEVAREKNRFIDDVAEETARTGTIPSTGASEHQNNMQRIFNKYYQRAIRTFSTEVESVAIPKASARALEIKRTLWEFLLAEWTTAHGATNVKESTQTTIDDVQNALNTALATEEPVSEQDLVSSILKTKGFSVFRANTIARTETHNAAMFASQGTASNISATTGVNLLKRWVPVSDERTREDHRTMLNSEAIPMDAFFDVGGEKLQRPGDPNGSPGNIINCRCVLTYEPAE